MGTTDHTDPFTLGREHATALRAAAELPTPPTDPSVLRALAALLDNAPPTLPVQPSEPSNP